MSEEKNHYLSKKESRKIASENKRFIRVLEKNKRRKADETEYTATLSDEHNIVEFENLHTYFFYRFGRFESGQRRFVERAGRLRRRHRRRVGLRKVCHEPVAHAPRAGAAGTDRGRRDPF